MSIERVASRQSRRSIESIASGKSKNWRDQLDKQEALLENAWDRLSAWEVASVDARELDRILWDENSLLPPASSRSVARSRSMSVDSVVSRLSRASMENIAPQKSRNWRDTLESQEAQLEIIRDRLSALDVWDEDQLSLRGEKLLDDLSMQLSQYDASSARAFYDEDEDDEIETGDEIGETKKLLVRLCNLEERLLSREIDLEQIKLDLHNLELEAVSRSEEWGLTASQLEVE